MFFIFFKYIRSTIIFNLRILLFWTIIQINYLLHFVFWSCSLFWILLIAFLVKTKGMTLDIGHWLLYYRWNLAFLASILLDWWLFIHEFTNIFISLVLLIFLLVRYYAFMRILCFSCLSSRLLLKVILKIMRRCVLKL